MKVVLGALFGIAMLFSVFPAGVVQAVAADGTTLTAPIEWGIQAGEDNGDLKATDILISVALLVLVFLFGLMIFSG